jgi:hypothetical protein
MRINTGNGESVTIEIVNLDDIKVNDSYQRKLNPKFVSYLSRKFDPTIVGVLHVARNQIGNYYVWDGQHRLAAMRERGIPKWPCIVTEKNTREQATAYSEANDGRLKIESYEHYIASLCAKDPVALSISRVIGSLGLKAAKSCYKPGSINCFRLLSYIVSRNGEEHLKSVLSFMDEIWADDPMCRAALAISAVSSVAERFPGIFSNKKCAEILGRHPLGKIVSKAKYAASVNSMTNHKALVVEIVCMIKPAKLEETKVSVNRVENKQGRLLGPSNIVSGRSEGTHQPLIAWRNP